MSSYMSISAYLYNIDMLLSDHHFLIHPLNLTIEYLMFWLQVCIHYGSVLMFVYKTFLCVPFFLKIGILSLETIANLQGK